MYGVRRDGDEDGRWMVRISAKGQGEGSKEFAKS